MFLFYITKIDKSVIDKIGFAKEDLLFFAVIAVASQFIFKMVVSFFRDSRHRFMSAKPIPKGSKADLKLMEKHMKSAESVTIYSGDFSFLNEREELTDILQDHAVRGNLTLISYKTEKEVFDTSISNPGKGTKLIETLLSNNKIFFSSPGRAKYSLIKAMGHEVFLYRYQDDGEDPFIGVFKAVDARSKRLLDTIEVLTNGIIVSGTNAATSNQRP